MAGGRWSQKIWKSKIASQTLIIQYLNNIKSHKLSSPKAIPVQNLAFWGALIEIVTDGRGLTCRGFRRLLARGYSEMGKIRHLKVIAAYTTRMS